MGEQTRDVTILAPELMIKLTAFLEELNRIDQHWDFVFEQIKNLELERCDLMHENELAEKKGAPDRSKFYDQLKEVNVTRRKYKDDKEILEPFKEWWANNKKIKDSLYKVLKKMNEKVEYHKIRVYQPRVRDDLSIARLHIEKDQNNTKEESFLIMGRPLISI